MHKSVAFYTLGCKLNFSETSAIGRQFKEAGYAVVPFEDGADIYVINTCSVTDHADRKCKKIVREAKKANPGSKVAIIGCYAQLKPEEIVSIPGVDMVLGAAEKFNLLGHIDELAPGKPIIRNGHIKEAKSFNAAYSIGDRTRTFLKVQDGCNYFCSFCTIPLARGRSRSDSIQSIVEQAKEVADQGIKEVVLTGVNIGDFGYPRNEKFIDLIKQLDKIEGIERFRISSIEPNLLNDEIIRFVAGSERFVPHFHIPLQSGSNKILRLMRRRYERSLYRDRISLIKRLMPDCCIGVDVIVGFPGEGEQEFMDTYKFLNELDISYLHVFPYSERPNTTAVRMAEVVPNSIRTERRKMLQILSEKKKRHFYGQHEGAKRKVLMEADSKDGRMHGFTDNYIKVSLPYDPLHANEMIDVHLEEQTAEGIYKAAPVHAMI